jgi:hypothetical protein
VAAGRRRLQWAAWRRTEERLERLLKQRLAADCTTKEDVMKRLRDAQSERST